MKRWIRWIVVFLATATLILFGIVLQRSPANRVVNMAKGNHFPCGRFVPEVRFERIPGCTGEGNVGPYRAHFSYNAAGFRDKDYAPRPDPGVTRILMLDGSILAGSGLEEPDSPVRRIETELRGMGWRKVEVINGAVEGFSTVENAIKIGSYLRTYHPQIVILYSVSLFKMFNDLVMGEYLIRGSGNENLRLKNLNSLVPSFLRIRGPTYLSIVYSLAELYYRAVVTLRLALLPPERREAEMMSVTLEMIQHMRDSATLHGANFYVLWEGMDSTSDIYLEPVHLEFLFRYLGRLFPRFSVRAATVEAELKRNKINVLSVASDYKSTLKEQHYIPGDHHWNVEGARVFGRIAASRIFEIRGSERKKP